MSAATFTVYFPNGEAVPYADASLFSLSQTLVAAGYHPKDRPLLIRNEDAGTKLYYNEHVFEQYLRGKINMRELLDSSWCHGLYRNKTDLKTRRNEEIDAGSLWLLRNDELIQIDADEFHTCAFNTAHELFMQIA